MTHAWWTQQDWNMDTYSEKPLKSSASTADAGTLFVRKPTWCFQQRLIAGFLQQKHTHCLVQKLKKLFFLSFWVTFARFFSHLETWLIPSSVSFWWIHTRHAYGWSDYWLKSCNLFGILNIIDAGCLKEIVTKSVPDLGGSNPDKQWFSVLVLLLENRFCSLRILARLEMFQVQ